MNGFEGAAGGGAPEVAGPGLLGVVLEMVGKRLGIVLAPVPEVVVVLESDEHSADAETERKHDR
jgi:hypothetical protein